MADKITISADIIEFLAEYHDIEDIRTDYSGRAMYGETCLGYTCNDVALFTFRLATEICRDERASVEQDGDPSLEEVEEMMLDIGDPRTDSMGRSTIYYWPNVTVTED